MFQREIEKVTRISDEALKELLGKTIKEEAGRSIIISELKRKQP